MAYEQEKEICDYLGLDVRDEYVYVYFGSHFSDGGRKPSGWQLSCHISKLKDFLTRKIHPEHFKKVNKKK